MSPPPSPVVRVLLAGAALSVGLAGSACTKEPVVTHNPPPPPEPDPLPTTNPPAPLPTWDEVESGHPEGATNPPRPVLEVSEDGAACYKAWFDPRMNLPEVREKGGIVLDPGQAPTGVPVQCPADQVATVLARHAEVKAAQGGEPAGGDTPAEGGE